MAVALRILPVTPSNALNRGVIPAVSSTRGPVVPPTCRFVSGCENGSYKACLLPWGPATSASAFCGTGTMRSNPQLAQGIPHKNLTRVWFPQYQMAPSVCAAPEFVESEKAEILDI